jgi:3-phytase
MKFISSICLAALFFSSCVNTGKKEVENNESNNQQMVQPVVITQAAQNDTDDPSIWINPNNPDESLILGTDKQEDGALYVYNLKGEIIEDKVVRNLKRPNNVDVLHQVDLGFGKLDLAFVSERFTSKMASASIAQSGLNKLDRQNKERVDIVSATIILQSYLEKKAQGF